MVELDPKSIESGKQSIRGNLCPIRSINSSFAKSLYSAQLGSTVIDSIDLAVTLAPPDLQGFTRYTFTWAPLANDSVTPKTKLYKMEDL